MNGFAVCYHEGTTLVLGCYAVECRKDVPEGWTFEEQYPGDAVELPIVAVEKARLIAYADPFTGSDRYLAEALAEQAAGNSEAYDLAMSKLLERKEQVKKENPWP